MRWAMGFVALAITAITMTGCKKSPSFGQAIALTIKANALSDTVRGSVRSLAINSSGAQSYTSSLPTPSGIGTVERTVYRPTVGTGDLQLSVTALDSTGAAVAYGTATATLASGKTVELTIVLSTNIPAMDMAAPNDLEGMDLSTTADLSTADLVIVDLATPPDLSPLVITPAAVWSSSGGGAGAASSGATIGVSIGGSAVGSATAVGSGGATLSFGKLGTAR